MAPETTSQPASSPPSSPSDTSSPLSSPSPKSTISSPASSRRSRQSTRISISSFAAASSIFTSPDSSRSASPKLKPQRHALWFRPGGNIVIQVECSLFKLDLAVLHEQSPILRSIVPPVYAGQTRYLGFNEERPFVLHEVKVVDFVRLLRVVYPDEVNYKKDLGLDDQLSILKLATQFQMTSIREQAIDFLDGADIGPIRKIAIWNEYHLDQHRLLSAYVDLCTRREPIAIKDAMVLGLKMFVKLAEARDRLHAEMGCGQFAAGTYRQRCEAAEDILQELFLRKDA